MKIEKLTKEQEAKFPEYIKKWTNIGLCTKRANRGKAENACKNAYKIAGLEEPKIILWAESPMGLLLTSKLIKEITKQGKNPYSKMNLASMGDSVWDSVRESVRASVWAIVGARVRDSVWASVRDRVRDSVWDSIRNSVSDSMVASMGARVRVSMGAIVGASVKASVRDSVGTSMWASMSASVWDSTLKNEYNELGSYGQHDANWLGFYEFFLNECNIKDCEKLLPLMNLAQETGWHLFYKDIAILSEKPIEISRNNQGRLHNNKGPAIKWKDGYELYRLNGVNVKKEVALLKPLKITKDLILKEPNADIRREIVRKLTSEQLVKKLKGKVLDKKYGYKLLGIDIGDGNVRPFLKMKNPSIKAIHIEGVRPGITSIKEAIKYRNGLTDFELPKKLT